MTTISELINNLPDQLYLDEAKGLNSLVQIFLSGEGGGNWAVKLNDGDIRIEEGITNEPQLTIKTSAQNALKLLNGKLNPLSAFMTGKIKVTGDLALAMKLISLLQKAGLGK